MGRKHTHDELNKCSHGELVTMVIAMQDQMDALNECSCTVKKQATENKR